MEAADPRTLDWSQPGTSPMLAAQFWALGVQVHGHWYNRSVVALEGPDCAMMTGLYVDDGEPSWCRWWDSAAGRDQSGYKVYIGGLPPGTDDTDVEQWVLRSVLAGVFHAQCGRLDSAHQPVADPRARHSLPGPPQLVDVHVTQGAASGVMQAFVTCVSPEDSE